MRTWHLQTLKFPQVLEGVLVDAAYPVLVQVEILQGGQPLECARLDLGDLVLVQENRVQVWLSDERLRRYLLDVIIA